MIFFSVILLHQANVLTTSNSPEMAKKGENKFCFRKCS